MFNKYLIHIEKFKQRNDFFSVGVWGCGCV